MMLPVCLFCLAENSCELRYDKGGRPYVVCKLCFTRSFLRSLDALRGVAVAPTLLKTALDLRKTDPAYREKVDGEIVRLIQDVANKATEPPVQEQQRGLPTGQKQIVPFILGQG